MELLLFVLFLIALPQGTHNNAGIETITIGNDTCKPLESSQYENLQNNTLVFNGETLQVIANSSDGKPIVCTTAIPRLEYEQPLVLVVQSIVLFVIALVACVVTFVCYQVLYCSARKLFTVLDITILNLNAAVLLFTFALFLENQFEPNLLLCKHVAFLVHTFYLYQVLALACFGVELTRIVVQKKLMPRIECRLILAYILVSLVIPIIIGTLTFIVNGANRPLVMYGLTANNTLQCWTNNIVAFVVTTVLPSTLVILFTVVPLAIVVYGTALRIKVSKALRRIRRRRRVAPRGTDPPVKRSSIIRVNFAELNMEEEPDPATLVSLDITKMQQIYDAVALGVCYVGNILTLILTFHIVLTIFQAVHAIRVLQTLQSVVVLLATLANKDVRDALYMCYKNQRRCGRRRRPSDNASTDGSESESSGSGASESDDNIMVPEARNGTRRRKDRAREEQPSQEQAEVSAPLTDPVMRQRMMQQMIALQLQPPTNQLPSLQLPTNQLPPLQLSTNQMPLRPMLPPIADLPNQASAQAPPLLSSQAPITNVYQVDPTPKQELPTSPVPSPKPTLVPSPAPVPMPAPVLAPNPVQTPSESPNIDAQAAPAQESVQEEQPLPPQTQENTN